MGNYLLHTAAKATAAGIVTFLGSVAAAFADDQAASAAEWWSAAAVAAAAAYATWQTPNTPAPAEPRHAEQ